MSCPQTEKEGLGNQARGLRAGIFWSGPLELVRNLESQSNRIGIVILTRSSGDLYRLKCEQHWSKRPTGLGCECIE